MTTQTRLVALAAGVLGVGFALRALAQTPPAGAPGGADVAVGAVVFPGGNGDLDATRVSVVLRGQSTAFLACYTAALQTTPTLAGELTVEVTLGHNGRPSTVTTTGLAGDPTAGPCVARAARTMVFPQPSTPMHAHAPVRFRAVLSFHPPPTVRAEVEPPRANAIQRVGGTAIPREAIRQAIRGYRSAVDHCYRRGLDGNPTLAGQVVIHFVVGADGHVTDTGVTDSPSDLSEVAGCIASAAMGWTFPVPTGAPTATFDHPFTLTSSPN